jgi:hypothetical protein
MIDLDVGFVTQPVENRLQAATAHEKVDKRLRIPFTRLP